MRIHCPLCGFGRDIDEAKIPPRAQMATCPKCQHKFRFRVVDDLEQYEAPVPPAQPPSGVPGFGGAPEVDPMAAQRAAAAEAWKRLQGPKPGEQAAEKVALEEPKPPYGGEQEPARPEPAQADAPARPAEPVPGWAAPQPAGSPVPFEDLPRHGFFGGLWGTITLVVKTPSEFFRAMPLTGGMSRPLIFHLLLAEFMVFCQFAWGLTSVGSMSQYFGSPELMDMGMGMAGAGSILLLVVYPLLLVMRLMIMTGILHLLLKLLRAGKGGPEATFRVLCYSAAPLLVGVIPFIGPMVGGLWSIVLTVLGLKEAHRTSISTALFAVLVPILMLVAAMLGLMQSGVMGK